MFRRNFGDAASGRRVEIDAVPGRKAEIDAVPGRRAKRPSTNAVPGRRSDVDVGSDEYVEIDAVPGRTVQKDAVPGRRSKYDQVPGRNENTDAVPGRKVDPKKTSKVNQTSNVAAVPDIAVKGLAMLDVKATGQRQPGANSSSLVSRKWLCVAGIDIGTSFSGWAYSMNHDPSKVYANATWYSGNSSMSSMKTSTCVLLKPDKKFEAFGFEAETQYSSLSIEGKHEAWFLFRNFKMKLYEIRELTTRTQIEDISGKKMPLVQILAHSIKFLTTHCLSGLKQKVPEILHSDVLFVLTVPAIWSDQAKWLMRHASQMAGLKNDQVVFALEPEAASIWCQHIKTEINREQARVDISGAGTQYMIVDIGGGTADITVHEKSSDGTLKELHTVSGGPWGGNNVNNAFLKLIESIVGVDVMAEFRQTELEDALLLEGDFEIKKRTVTEKSNDVMIKIPASLIEMTQKSGRTFDVTSTKYRDELKHVKDKLLIKASLVKQCFHQPLNDIITHVRKILSEPKMKNVKTIILVGGQSESEHVQTVFKNQFKDKAVVVPQDCGLAVVKGAVLFGHRPEAIASRVAKYTYGIEIAEPFDSRKHIQAKRTETDSGSVCVHVFKKIVSLGEDLELDHIVNLEGKAVQHHQREIIRKMYRSREATPMYTTDSDLTHVGDIRIPLDKNLPCHENVVEERYFFGGTEIVCETTHHKTGRTSKSVLSLND